MRVWRDEAPVYKVLLLCIDVFSIKNLCIYWLLNTPGVS